MGSWAPPGIRLGAHYTDAPAEVPRRVARVILVSPHRRGKTADEAASFRLHRPWDPGRGAARRPAGRIGGQVPGRRSESRAGDELSYRAAGPAHRPNRIPGLNEVRREADGLHLGAMTRQRTLEHDPRVAEAAPLLAEAVPLIAHPQIRNRGTIGGSLAHADPAAELPVLAVALGARLRA